MAMQALQTIYHNMPSVSWEGVKSFGNTYHLGICVSLFTAQEYYVSEKTGNYTFTKMAKALLVGATVGTTVHYLWIGAQKIAELVAPVFASNVFLYVGWLVTLALSLELFATIVNDPDSLQRD